MLRCRRNSKEFDGADGGLVPPQIADGDQGIGCERGAPRLPDDRRRELIRASERERIIDQSCDLILGAVRTKGEAEASPFA